MTQKKLPRSFHLVSLGCAKNLVDSERMIGRLINAGLTVTETPEEADAIIVNTCGFIESAINESIDTILELAALKETNPDKQLIVAGCLPERYKADLSDSIPEADMLLGTGAHDYIVDAVTGKEKDKLIFPDPDNSTNFGRFEGHLVLSNPVSAYLKVAEGCDNCCSYCIIPKLRGKKRSRTFDDIMKEGEALIASGVKEILLIAQDTTAYGSDLTPPATLTSLLNAVSGLSKDVRFRFLYGHPKSITKELVDTVVRLENVSSYFDLPIQHASTDILKKMGRGYATDDLFDLFEYIRKSDKEATLRTTVITGFPGETYKDFDILLKFIEDIRFDHLGVFTYSDSEDIKSHRLPDHVTGKTAKNRKNKIMELQKIISNEKNKERIGKTVRVLIEDYDEEEGRYIGRTDFQAPDIDGVTLVRAENLTPGDFTSAVITHTTDYDIYGDAS